MAKVSALVDQNAALQQELHGMRRENARLQRMLQEATGLVHRPYALGDGPRSPLHAGLTSDLDMLVDSPPRPGSGDPLARVQDAGGPRDGRVLLGDESGHGMF